MNQSTKNLFSLPEGDLAGIISQAQADLEGLHSSRIFITGGTGFFGRWLLGALAYAERELGLGLHVTILSRDPAAFLARHPEIAHESIFHFVRGHVADFAPPQGGCDFVLHAAADTIAFTRAQDEEERARAIVAGTRRMLEFARAGEARCFLYASSGAVYGPATARPTGAREEDDLDPTTPYGRAKMEAENLCINSELECVIARAFAFLGPHLPLDAHFAAGNFLRDARRGGPIEVRGDGTALRSYLYPADLIVWLLRLFLRGERGRAYNVGSDERVTTAELGRRIAAACAPAPEVVVQSQQPHGPQNIYLPDITRARTELGLDVTVKLDDAIRRTLQWME
jgi:nucleoside-diphosphate-sugar epimerase